MKKFNVLFLHPSAHPGKPLFITMPMGMISTMNHIKSNCNVRAINIGLEMSLNRDYKIRDELEKTDFNIAAIGLHWHEHSFTALETARLCKEVNPGCTVILGGITASIFARDILSEFNPVDAIITGDGEIPMTVLLRSVQNESSPGKNYSNIPNLAYRSGRGIKQNPVMCMADQNGGEDYTDISSLKHWEEYLKSNINFYSKNQFWYSYWLSIARGCIYNCSFCGGGGHAHNKIFNRTSIFFRHVNHLIRDIKDLRDIGVHTVNFSHDPQMAGRKYWLTLFRRLREEKIEIGAYIEITNLPGEEFAKEFEKTFALEFSTLAVTPLSGSEKIRMKNGKDFTNRALLDKIELQEKLGIPYALYFATGLPFENETSFEKTLQLAEKVSSGSHLKMIFNTPFTIDPGSPMYNNPEKYGVFPHLRSFNDYYERCKKRANGEAFDLFGYHTENLSARKMMKLQERWNRFIEGKLPGIIGNSTMSNLNFL